MTNRLNRHRFSKYRLTAYQCQTLRRFENAGGCTVAQRAVVRRSYMSAVQTLNRHGFIEFVMPSVYSITPEGREALRLARQDGFK